MAKVFSDRTIVAIDVGTTKICVLVAEILGDDQIAIVGVGRAPSDGLQKGVVVNIGQTIRSIKLAVKEAELMAGMSISSAYIGISGSHIHSINSHGVVAIKRGVVRAADINNALAAAQAVPISADQHILHVLPQYFTVDNHSCIKDPTGMHGVRLEVRAHIITGATASVRNLMSCCEQAGVQVRDIILEPLASAHAVLSKDEQELGAGILDIGGGTSDFAVYQMGTIRHTKVIPIAGTQFTRDIAVGLRTTLEDAEIIKKEHGACHESMIDKNMKLTIACVQGNEHQIVEQKYLIHIVHARAHELLSMVKIELDKFDIRHYMASGLVLTGGGALLAGLDDLAHEILGMPVRVGMPKISFQMPVSLNSPMYATVYGLLLCAVNKNNIQIAVAEGPLIKKIFTSMKSWVSDFF